MKSDFVDFHVFSVVIYVWHIKNGRKTFCKHFIASFNCKICKAAIFQNTSVMANSVTVNLSPRFIAYLVNTAWCALIKYHNHEFRLWGAVKSSEVVYSCPVLPGMIMILTQPTCLVA